MKKITVSILVVLTLLNNIAHASSDDKGVVYYFEFEIERITGIPEKEITDIGCKFLVDFNSFLSQLKNSTGEKEFDETDVRASVEYQDRKYFIDYTGLVKDENMELFEINKEQFRDSLISFEKCSWEK